MSAKSAILSIIDSHDGPQGMFDYGAILGADGWGALDASCSVAISDRHGLLVARVLRDTRPDRDGNRFPPSLFANAPETRQQRDDLLEAIQAMRSTIAMGNEPKHWDTDKTTKWLDKLIAKATGEVASMAVQDLPNSNTRPSKATDLGATEATEDPAMGSTEDNGGVTCTKDQNTPFRRCSCSRCKTKEVEPDA